MFNKAGRKTIYLDHASLTPVDEGVLRVMYDYDKTHVGNPSGIHADSVMASNELEKARTTVAGFLSCRKEEVVFTSGGTEGDNLAIWGAVLAYKGTGLPHIVTTNIEHSAVRELCLYLENPPAGGKKAEVTFVAVGADGVVDPKEIKKALKPNTVLVSVQYANNEVGTIQPIREIAKVVRQYRKENADSVVLFHTDAAQAMQYCNTNVQQIGVDMLSFNGSKMYGPRGSGVLFKKHGIPFAPVFYGGHQEHTIRPGTVDVGRAVGLAKAFETAVNIADTETIRLTQLRDYFIDELYKIIPDMVLHGSKTQRLPNNINVSIPGYNSEAIVVYLDAKGIRVSEKSACQSDTGTGSYVLEALEYAKMSSPATKNKDSENIPVYMPHSVGSVRFTLGRSNTKSEIDYTVSTLRDILKLLKSEK
ncbi:MAG: cysteine desulfurase family protein [Minisyncoccia bacterium]